MKLELDMWRQLLDLYTKFKLSISKDAEKIPKYLKNSKRTKIIAKVPKTRFLRKTELVSISIQRATHVANLKDLSWFMRPWLQNISLAHFQV